MNSFEQTQLQQRLNRVESSLLRLLNHLPGLAYRCSASTEYEYNMVFVSQGCEKLLGLTQDEILCNPTNTVELMTLEEDLAHLRMAVFQGVSSHSNYEVYYRIRLASGDVKWIWDQGEGVYDAEGNCVFLEGIMMDVTAQKTREQQLKKQNRQLNPGSRNPNGLGRIMGTSAVMREAYELIRRAACSDTNIILYGETGVGKDLVAKTIHELSGLKGRFIPVNCGAIPEQLLESEFFGHVKGAFSGATTNRAGYLAAADNGTLFLDEIGELPLNLQVKLLRALESRTYTPIGSTEPRRSSFRLVSATNRDLKAMVQLKTMREDFFYRVNVLPIVVPALRDRKEDIPLLVAAYAAAKGLEPGLPPDVATALLHYDWPGNVRELQNVMERYWVFGSLDLRHAGQDRPGAVGTLGFPPDEEGIILVPGKADMVCPVLAGVREETEKRQILAVLDSCHWKKAQSAEKLGITTRTLQRKLKKYGISRFPGGSREIQEHGPRQP